MKKIILLLIFLYSTFSISQTSSGMEQEFDYGIKNNSSQQLLTPDTLVTKGVDGTYGHASAYRLPVSTATQAAIDVKVASNAGLQNAYNFEPEIVTSAIKGAVAIRRGSAADTDTVLSVQNGAGTNTFSVTGAGVLNASNKQNSLAPDGTGVKFPTVDAVNDGLAFKSSVLSSISELNSYVRGSNSVIVSDTIRGGVFDYIPSGLTVDNGLVFAASDGGFWVRQHTQTDNINVEWFGALGNGATDDSVAIQSALDFLNTNGGTLFFSSKTYLCGNLKLYSNTTMLGSNATLKFKSGAQYLVSINEGSGGTTSIADNQKNINIKGISFVGRVVEDAFFQFKHLLNINAATNVKVENCSFIGFQGDGIYLGSSNTGVERHNTNIIIDKCFFDGINKDNRNAISVIDCDGLIISNSTFVNTTRSNMPGAIDVEPNPNNYAIARNITISNNKLSNIGGNVAAISCYFPVKQETLLNPIYNIKITNNSIVNCAYGITVKQITDGLLLTTPSMDAIVYGNHVRNVTNYGMLIENIKDIVIDSNAFIDIAIRSHLGFASNNSKVINSALTNNYFLRAGTVDGIGLNVTNVNSINISNNYFEDCGKSDGTFGYAIDFGTNSTSNYVTLSGNKISSPNAKTTWAIQKEVTHTFTPANNVSINNQLIGVGGNNFVSSANEQPVSNSQLNALVSSAAYTPTLTNSLNVTAATLESATYTKVGNIVNVRLGLTANVTAANTASQITFTLPVNRTVSTILQVGSLNGFLSTGANPYYGGTVQTLATTNTARMFFKPDATGANTFIIDLQYNIN